MHKFDDITDAVLKYQPNANLDIIWRAYLFSAKAHRGQLRQSGEAFLSHPLEVAFNLTKLKMDELSVAVGLLHDTLEDTMATPEEIKEQFGEEVYHLVEGVTKISQIEFGSREEKQAENFRKMILAMAKDIRVILIKLADRVHNLKTLDSLPPESQKCIAAETLDIFAPLAHRLGIGWVKAELENGCFKYLYPEEAKQIERKLKQEEQQRLKFVQNVNALVNRELEQSLVPGRVMGRPKHIYSIYSKMISQNLSFEEVYDLIGIRVITETVKDCYAVLGLVHSLWKPIPGKFKDYVAMPKPNLYQSLHTTVVGLEGQRMEIQIRTEEMHRISEEGIAAHWQYKEGGSGQPKKIDEQLSWIRHFLEQQDDLKSSVEFLDAFKVDLYPHEVYVFTPLGEVVALPKGASPIDFAFYVHTDIGCRCLGAKVNGKIVPLRYKLRNGDRVEILTSKEKEPNRDWLSYAKTSRARSKIISYLNSKEREKNLEIGRVKLDGEIESYNLKPTALLKGKNFDEAIHACGFNSFENVLMAISLGKLSVHHFVEKLLPREKLETHQKRTQSKSLNKLESFVQHESGIRIKVFDVGAMLLRVGKCCSPVPGDEIVGYLTRGRGVSVHTADCHRIIGFASDTERILEVEWEQDPDSKIFHGVQVSLVTMDKPGMLAKISSVLVDCGVNITRATVNQGPYKRAYFDLSIQISDLGHLNETLDALRSVDGVIHAARRREYQKKGIFKETQQGGDFNPNDSEGMVVN